MNHEVQLAASLRDCTGGAASVSIEAATIRELFRKLVERYPRLESRLRDGIAVSVNGDIFRDDWNQAIPEGAEVFLLPRINGG
ncbi:MAG: MoaD/ThiS family protein [Pseudomonadales bacterium]|nr:MoaD/ThiS family protein [Pseudomonadales bacterium]MCP5184709.1 MoaD/ThiS family protein [Pseudomonadales bacterium]